MRWAVMGGKGKEVRFQALSEFLTAQGYANQMEFFNPEINDFYLELEKLVSKVDQIRLEEPYSHRAQDFQNKSTDFVNLVGSADSVIKFEDGSWWPDNLTYEAFSAEFVTHVRQLDLNSYVLVVGAGPASRVIIAALIKLGFSKFYISDSSEEIARKDMEIMTRRFFNVQFDFVSIGGLMLLPGSSSVLINSTPLVPENDVMRDLYYFNFLKLPGTSVDLNLFPAETPLMEESRRVGAETLGGFEIATRTDVNWVKKTLNRDIDLKAYREFMKQKFSAIPFDPTPYRLA